MHETRRRRRERTSPSMVSATECMPPAATWRTLSDGRICVGTHTSRSASRLSRCSAHWLYSLPPKAYTLPWSVRHRQCHPPMDACRNVAACTSTQPFSFFVHHTHNQRARSRVAVGFAGLSGLALTWTIFTWASVATLHGSRSIFLWPWPSVPRWFHPQVDISPDAARHSELRLPATAGSRPNSGLRSCNCRTQHTQPRAFRVRKNPRRIAGGFYNQRNAHAGLKQPRWVCTGTSPTPRPLRLAAAPSRYLTARPLLHPMRRLPAAGGPSVTRQHLWTARSEPVPPHSVRHHSPGRVAAVEPPYRFE